MLEGAPANRLLNSGTHCISVDDAGKGGKFAMSSPERPNLCENLSRNIRD
jgi:hypothetical protein